MEYAEALRILGVSKGESLEDITKKYRHKVKMCHTDVTLCDSHDKIANLNVAYALVKKAYIEMQSKEDKPTKYKIDLSFKDILELHSLYNINVRDREGNIINLPLRAVCQADARFSVEVSIVSRYKHSLNKHTFQVNKDGVYSIEEDVLCRSLNEKMKVYVGIERTTAYIDLNYDVAMARLKLANVIFKVKLIRRVMKDQ